LTEQAYRSLFESLQNEVHHHPVRIWNFVPGILDPAGEGLDRYMRFNAGRHRAYLAAFGRENSFDQCLPAASAVGHRGTDLVIHMLSSQSAGIPISNPRQHPPHRYSRRFGPLPPCFARATLIATETNQRFLLIGGTASIRGEESMHIDDLNAQLHETRNNLIAVLAVASGKPPSPALLNHLDQLRVYYPRSENQPVIEQATERWFNHPAQIEWRHADLCRADLMVEIEGRAILPA
jgi:chorismate lyase/3-hydroxybenzoate synthase